MDDRTPEPAREFAPAHGDDRYFGDYELLREIGRGGMGVVYEARQFGTQRTVALKFLAAGALATREAIHRFHIEAKAAALLDHPNIVPVYEVGIHEGQYFLAMRYLGGGTLAALAARESLSPKHCAELVQQIALAIQYAHTHGVLHRDLNPRNILLTDSGTPVVSDFGLAQIAQIDERLTITRSLLGTAPYMAPEQATAGIITTVTDIYALGAILYELLTGRPPFSKPNMPAVLRAIAEESPTDPSILNPRIPRDLATICLKCLEKSPAQRYASGESLAEDLGRFLRNEPISARPTSPAVKLWRWAQRNPALAAAYSILALMVALVLIFSPLALFRINSERKRAEQSLYVSTIQLATRELHENRPLYARRLLHNVNLSPEQASMRDWEWRHLMNRALPQHSEILSHHKSYVSAVALSQNGQWAAALDGTGTARLWDLPARELKREWIAHGNPDREKPNFSGMAATFSPDSRFLATGGRDRTVRLWPIPARTYQMDLGRLNDTCTHLAFSRDGKLLAALSITGEITLWSFVNDSARFLSRWHSPGLLFQDLALSADSRTLAAAGYAQAAHLWDISVPSSPSPPTIWPGTAWPLASAPHANIFAASDSSGRQMHLFDADKRTPATLQLPSLSSVAVSTAFSPDGGKIAVGLVGGEIVIQYPAGKKEPITLTGHEDYVTSIAFSPDGQELFSGSRDQTVRLWKIPENQPGSYKLSHGFYALAVRFSQDSRYLASISKDTLKPEARQHSIKLWDLNTLKEIASARMDAGALTSHPIYLSPDQLAVDDWGNHTEIFHIPSLQRRAEFKGHSPVAQSSNILFATENRIVSKAIGPHAATEATILDAGSPVWTFALTPDQRTLAFTSEEGTGSTIYFWDTARRKILGSATSHENRIYALRFSPDGRMLATAALDSKICIWQTESHQLLATLRGHTGDLSSLSFTPDGRRLASCGEDGAIRLWDTETFLEVARIDVPSYLCSLDFSPDSEWLAAAGGNGTIYLWHAPSMKTFEQIR